MATKTFGSTIAPEVLKGEDQLEVLAEAYAKEHSCSADHAYSKVLETAAGQAIYNKMRAN